MVISEDELKSRLDRVNSWISNCDQKASILLAVEGVMLTILCTPDYISWIRQKLIFPIYNYYETGYGEFSITNFACCNACSNCSFYLLFSSSYKR